MNSNSVFNIIFSLCICTFLIINAGLGVLATIYANRRGHQTLVILSIISIFLQLAFIIAPIVYITCQPKWHEAENQNKILGNDKKPISRKEFLLLNLKDSNANRRVEAIRKLSIDKVSKNSLFKDETSFDDELPDGMSYIQFYLEIRDQVRYLSIFDPSEKVRTTAYSKAPPDIDFVRKYLNRFIELVITGNGGYYTDEIISTISLLTELSSLDLMLYTLANKNFDLHLRCRLCAAIALYYIQTKSENLISDSQNSYIRQLQPQNVYEYWSETRSYEGSDGATYHDYDAYLWTLQEIFEKIRNNEEYFKNFNGIVENKFWKKDSKPNRIGTW